MNILFVHETCGYLGGVEQNVADSTQLRERGHRCRLAWARRGRDAAQFADLFDDAASLDGGLDRLLDRWQPDVVYLHKIARVPPLLDACRGRRVVRMVHDHDLCCPRSHRYTAFGGRICPHPAGWRCWADGAFVARSRSGRFPLRMVDLPAHLRELRAHAAVDQLIVASRYMRDQLVLNGLPASHIRVLAPAVNLPQRLPTAIPGHGRVLFVGQLVRGKGVDLLLDAFSRMRRAWHLDIVGIGNARDALERQARRLSLSSRVRFHGWIPRESQTRLYEQCDVAVVPSRWPEPFGMVGLQAMIHGRPVVAFDVGGIGDWLDEGETGLRVPEQDVAAMAGAITALLDDSARAGRMGRCGFERARERFSFHRYLRDLERILAPDASRVDPTPGKTT